MTENHQDDSAFFGTSLPLVLDKTILTNIMSISLIINFAEWSLAFDGLYISMLVCYLKVAGGYYSRQNNFFHMQIVQCIQFGSEFRQFGE